MSNEKKESSSSNILFVCKGQKVSEIDSLFFAEPVLNMADGAFLNIAGVIDIANDPDNEEFCKKKEIKYVTSVNDADPKMQPDCILCLFDLKDKNKLLEAYPQAEILSSSNAKSFLYLLREAMYNARESKDALLRQSAQIIEKTKKIQSLYNEVEAKNKALMELEQLKTSFISMVSHELRTPITVIGEGMSLLRDRVLGELTPKQERIVNMTRENVAKLGNIISELLDISTIEAGRISLRRDTIDLKEVFNKTISAFENKLKKAGLELKVSICEKPVIAYADGDKISQVLMNLINNAIKFSPENGQIEISLKSEKDNIYCSIKDNGPGIPQEEMPLIFEKFHQFDKNAHTLTKGMGLGLYVVKNIIELHGGRVWVDSIKDQGSVFSFDLPSFATQKQSINKSIDDKIDFISKIGESEFFTLLIIDIENLQDIFKEVNPDETERIKLMIKNSISQTLQKQEDTIIGSDGSTFIVLLSNTNKSGSKFVCKKLNATFTKNKEKISRGIDIKTRFGVASYPFDGTDSKALFKKAKNSLMRKKNIVVIDDDVDFTQLLAKEINDSDKFSCFQVNSGYDAMKVILEQKPDMIISELAMMGMSGYELVGQVKADEQIKDIPIVLMSKYDIESTSLSSLLPGSIPVLKKDEGFEKVLKLISELV